MNPAQWAAAGLAGWCAISVIVAAGCCLLINHIKKGRRR